MMLPCVECSRHANKYISSRYHELDDICSSKHKLFTFFVDFHNKVNARFGKPEMRVENAYKLYLGGANVQRLLYN